MNLNLDEIEEFRRQAQVVLDEGQYFAGRSYVQGALGQLVPLIQHARDLEAELLRLLLELGHVRTLHDRSATEAIKVGVENKQLRFEAEKQTIIADILRAELQIVLGTAVVFGPPGLGERLKGALEGEGDD